MSAKQNAYVLMAMGYHDALSGRVVMTSQKAWARANRDIRLPAQDELQRRY